MVEGWVSKHDEGNLLSNKRYAVLFSDRLEYYKSDKAWKGGQPPQGVIDFSLISCALEMNNKGQMVITMEGCKKNFCLKETP